MFGAGCVGYIRASLSIRLYPYREKMAFRFWLYSQPARQFQYFPLKIEQASVK